MRRKFGRTLSAAALAATLLVAGTPAAARQTTNTLQARVTVFTGCSLVTRPMTFVVPNLTVNAAVDTTTTLTIKCTPNTNFTVDIDKGLYANGINRRMYSPASNSYVSYDVYRDSPRSKVWGTGQLKNVSGNSGNGAPLVITLFGRIPASGKIKAGDYADRLLVTVNF